MQFEAMLRPSKFDIAVLQSTQRLQAEQVSVQDNFAEPQWIAGADVGFEQHGQVVRAVISVLHYPSLVMIEYRIARIPTPLPYIPGLLSFREYPGLLAAWRTLVHRPQLVLVDGHGIAHPRRLGIASHLGLLTGVATIGVAKQRLIGTMQPLSESFNAVVPLLENKQQLGWVWRSKERCRPLYVSPGHHISLNSALLWVQRCMRGYRLPEPIRWADAVASRRSCFQHHCFNQQ